MARITSRASPSKQTRDTHRHCQRVASKAAEASPLRASEQGSLRVAA
jgi:hypothetical protein